jgi:phosphinothricin acetyltransferase
MQIREATRADLPAVAAIHAREAREGHATFDLDGRPMEVWEEMLAGDGHFLVAEHDGEVVGYASSGTFRPRPAYRHTRESTVYVARGHQGLGTGRALYDALLALLADDGVHLVVAAVALPNEASLALHHACGFEDVGTMREVGRKHGRWIDVAWLHKVLD